MIKLVKINTTWSVDALTYTFKNINIFNFLGKGMYTLFILLY